jgi:hypothetical protein
MTSVVHLNRRLGEGLGLVLGGSQPKYQWRLTTKCFYYFRPMTSLSIQRMCWAERLGTGYVLCMWRLPEVFDTRTNSTKVLTEAEWKQNFNGMIPYPDRGQYSVFAETFTREVTPELNQNYIRAIDQQQSQSYADHLERIALNHALDREQWREKFEDATFDAAPAFGNFVPGSRDGHVSFPSVGGK